MLALSMSDQGLLQLSLLLFVSELAGEGTDQSHWVRTSSVGCPEDWSLPLSTLAGIDTSLGGSVPSLSEEESQESLCCRLKRVTLAESSSLGPPQSVSWGWSWPPRAGKDPLSAGIRAGGWDED